MRISTAIRNLLAIQKIAGDIDVVFIRGEGDYIEVINPECVNIAKMLDELGSDERPTTVAAFTFQDIADEMGLPVEEFDAYGTIPVDIKVTGDGFH